MKRWMTYWMVMLGSVFLFGCGGGDDDASDTPVTGGDDAVIEGLSVPSTMSIVSAQEQGGGATGGIHYNLPGIKAFSDPGTHYANDKTHTYVYDASMESLGTVNMILCLLAQTGATQMVNKGPYIALVNEDECEQGENQSSTGETGQSSSGSATEYNTWTVSATRANNSAPQIVKIWVPGESRPENGGGGDPRDAMDAQTILVEVTINEASSDSKPFGDFVLNFKGVVDAGLLGGQQGTEIETMQGTLQTVANANGLPQFRFINVEGDAVTDHNLGFGSERSVSVIMDDAHGTGGRALTYNSETNENHPDQSSEQKFAIAFDSGHLLRGKDTDADNVIDAQQCLSRDDFNTHVWRYNVYHKNNGTYKGTTVTEGQRVALNGGFPFAYDSDNNGSDDAHGWVGYHGVWSQDGALADGTTINKFDYATDTSEACTVNISAGKLVRRTAQHALLAEFQGAEFQYWGPHPTLNIFGQWIVTVNNNSFSLTGRSEWGQNGPVVSATVDHDNNPQTSEVSVVAAISLSHGQNLHLWSDALGGNMVYVHDTNLAPQAREVTFYGQEFLSPADAMFAGGNVTLYCYERCMKGGLTQTDVDNAGGQNDLYYTYSGTPFQYTLSASNGKITLTDNTNNQPVTAATLDMSGLGMSWGINTGEMITTPLADPSHPWMVFQEAVSYRWETGSNDWNKQVTVTDSHSEVMTFDSPLRFTYTHSTANDANDSAEYDGRKFMLEYAGPGELRGFPWVVNDENGRWHAAITLANGVELDNGDNAFVVKALEQEQSMNVVNLLECSAFDLNGVLSDTAIALPTASAISDVSFSLADKPNVTDPPAVIAGELQ